MARLDGDRFVLARNVSDYLLNPEHPDGGPKAIFFMRFGFDPRDSSALVEALGAHPLNNDIVMVVETRFGLKTVVQCRLETPDGRNPCICSVWVREVGSLVHRLVTAYPA